MAHSGALRFTQEVFSNINEHKYLPKQLLKNTYLYRHTTKIKRLVETSLEIKKVSDFNWVYNKNVKIAIIDNVLISNYMNIDRFSMIKSNFDTITGVSSVELNITLPQEAVKMLSITLNDKKEYAHFFIKPKDIIHGIIHLSDITISKKSKNFILNKINSISIRMYPKDSDELHNFIIKDIRFNTFVKGKI
jgi:hypothetical protein